MEEAKDLGISNIELKNKVKRVNAALDSTKLTKSLEKKGFIK